MRELILDVFGPDGDSFAGRSRTRNNSEGIRYVREERISNGEPVSPELEKQQKDMFAKQKKMSNT